MNIVNLLEEVSPPFDKWKNGETKRSERRERGGGDSLLVELLKGNLLVVSR